MGIISHKDLGIRPVVRRGFPGGSVVKNLSANAGDVGSIPGSGGSPGEGNGNSLQYSCLENTMDREEPGRATVHRVAKSWTRLSDQIRSSHESGGDLANRAPSCSSGCSRGVAQVSSPAVKVNGPGAEAGQGHLGVPSPLVTPLALGANCLQVRLGGGGAVRLPPGEAGQRWGGGTCSRARRQAKINSWTLRNYEEPQ